MATEKELGGDVNAVDSILKSVKLPYFHRELSTEDSAILGSSAPQPIAPALAAVASSSASSSSSSSSSAWNAAQSWEEKNITSAAIGKLSTLFEASFDVVPLSLPFVSYSIIEATGIKGSANIVNSRGKIRYLYDLSFELKFELTQSAADGGSGSGTSFLGSLQVDDLTNDLAPSDYEVQVKSWDGARPQGQTMKAALSALISPSFRSALKSKITAFEEEIRK